MRHNVTWIFFQIMLCFIMRLYRYNMQRLLILIICFCFAVSISHASNSPIEAMLDRISDGLSGRIKIELAENVSDEDYFEIFSDKKNATIKGNNYSSIGAGINWFLKYYLNIHLSWNNMHALIPEEFPVIEIPVKKSTGQKIRYHFNYCTYGYSMPFWDWERWQQEIDWLLLHGINTPLTITGTECVWRNVLKDLGYNEAEINEFIPGPAFLPWWEMNNLEAWGGPLPASWYEGQEALQKKILKRMQEFGMSYVLPGYAGMVPSNIGRKLGFQVTDPGHWCGFQRPAFLLPSDPNFQKIAALYYHHLTRLYGKADYYSIDPFHEGGSVEGVNLEEAGKVILSEMKKVNPQATWVIQAWQANPRPELIDGLAEKEVLVLDLWSECRPQWGNPNSLWHRKEGFGKHNWLYCNVLNFGGNVGLYGKMDTVIAGFDMARNHALGKKMVGVGMAMEGIENNPVMFELFYELPWYTEKISKQDWVNDYTIHRYGKSLSYVKKAWQILSNTVYNCPTIQEGTSESIFCARPDSNITKVSCCSVVDTYYHSDSVEVAAGMFFKAMDELDGCDNYQYDLIDIFRQCLANKGLKRYRNMMASYQARELEDFVQHKNAFLNLIQDQDLLLSCRKEFMLGTWLKMARDKGAHKSVADLYEYNARRIITTWGNRFSSDEAGLKDYSHREWAGLLKDYYYPRWKMYLEWLESNLQGNVTEFPDFYIWEEQWTQKHDVFEYTARENIPEVVRYISKKYDIK